MGEINKPTDGVYGGYPSETIMISTSLVGGEINFYSNQLTIKLYQKFINTYGSVICQKIHGRISRRTFNLWDKEEKRKFEELGVNQDKCTNIVTNATVQYYDKYLKKR